MVPFAILVGRRVRIVALGEKLSERVLLSRGTRLHDKPALAVKQGSVSGTVTLAANAAAKRAAYGWQYSTDQKTWTSLPPTLQSKTGLSGLTVGTTYYFRVQALIPGTLMPNTFAAARTASACTDSFSRSGTSVAAASICRARDSFAIASDALRTAGRRLPAAASCRRFACSELAMVRSTAAGTEGFLVVMPGSLEGFCKPG